MLIGIEGVGRPGLLVLETADASPATSLLEASLSPFSCFFGRFAAGSFNLDVEDDDLMDGPPVDGTDRSFLGVF